VKGKVDQQLLMFVCFFKKKTSNQGKKKRKESMKQGRKYKGDCTFQFQIHQKHIFKPLIKFTKIKFQNIYIIGGYKSLLDFMLKIQGLTSQNTKLHGWIAHINLYWQSTRRSKTKI